jgi:hypothetical protein
VIRRRQVAGLRWTKPPGAVRAWLLPKTPGLSAVLRDLRSEASLLVPAPLPPAELTATLADDFVPVNWGFQGQQCTQSLRNALLASGSRRLHPATT